MLSSRLTDDNSVPDTYEACEAKRLAGATPLEILRDIAAMGGGLLVLHMLEADVMSPQFPTGTTPDDWEMMVAPPPPTPQQIREDKLADRLQVLNPELAAPAANAVARQCLYLLGKRGLNGSAECQRYPVFSSGSDVETATEHDLGAIKSWLPWTLLNYDERGQSKPGYGEWYKAFVPCIPGSYDGSVHHCDEFPFISTLQGGPEPFGGRRPDLELINASDNSLQGSLLFHRLYNKCGFTVRVDNPEFLNVPLSPTGPVGTIGLCNGFG
jgi:hypothetical protein